MSETQVAARKMVAASKSFPLASTAFYPFSMFVGQFFNTELFSPGLSFKNLFKIAFRYNLKRTIRDYTTLPIETLICVKLRQERMRINTNLML